LTNNLLNASAKQLQRGMKEFVCIVVVVLPGEGEVSESRNQDASEVCAIDAADENLAEVVAADWREVDHFDDQLIALMLVV
jgi:hypothetical protein